MDFEATIRELIKQGHSFNEISEEFDKAYEEMHTNPVDEIYNQAFDNLTAAMEDNVTFTRDTVTDAAICWAVENHEDWGKDEIDLVKEMVPAVLKLTEDTLKALKPLFKQEEGNKEETKSESNDFEALKKFIAQL